MRPCEAPYLANQPTNQSTNRHCYAVSADLCALAALANWLAVYSMRSLPRRVARRLTRPSSYSSFASVWITPTSMPSAAAISEWVSHWPIRASSSMMIWSLTVGGGSSTVGGTLAALWAGCADASGAVGGLGAGVAASCLRGGYGRGGLPWAAYTRSSCPIHGISIVAGDSAPQ